MKKLFFLFFSLIFLVSCGINCEQEKLGKTCASFVSNSCLVFDEEIIIFENEQEFQDFQNENNLSYSKDYSQCKLGKTECFINENDEFVISCVGHVEPTEEICDDTDNNCDGDVDEGFDLDGDGFSCNDCNDKNLDINPSAEEICDGIDNNCDGIVDDFYEKCWTGGLVNFIGSPCQKGTKFCSNGKWGECKDQIFPSFELCDGIDNDCDGVIDESIPKSCGPETEEGLCTKGTQICTNSGESLCVDAVFPVDELCDGIDNDCDGEVDEGLERTCRTACGSDTEICLGGNWICNAQVPVEEICDGIDNDCDGETDEGCPCSPNEVTLCKDNIMDENGNLRECGVGLSICDMNGNWGACDYVGIEDEQCDNWDNDCDGVVDNITQICGNQNFAGIGECRLGEKTCSMGMWGNCENSVNPETEICDNKDNDCDGEIDEGLNPHEKVNIVFAIDQSGSMASKTSNLTLGLSNYVNDFVNTEHKFALVIFPGTYPDIPASLVSDFVDFSTFQLQLMMNNNASQGGSEPSYDVMEVVISTENTLNLSWESDAYPYVILITDENAQSWMYGGLLTNQQRQQRENDIISIVNGCGNMLSTEFLPGCSQGDVIEAYIITNLQYLDQWDGLGVNRVLSISPNSPEHYTLLLRQIFSNACIGE